MAVSTGTLFSTWRSALCVLLTGSTARPQENHDSHGQLRIEKARQCLQARVEAGDVLRRTNILMSFPRQDYTVTLTRHRRIASRTATGYAGWSHPATIGTSATPSVTETMRAACSVSPVILDRNDEEMKAGYCHVF